VEKACPCSFEKCKLKFQGRWHGKIKN